MLSPGTGLYSAAEFITILLSQSVFHKGRQKGFSRWMIFPSGYVDQHRVPFGRTRMVSHRFRASHDIQVPSETLSGDRCWHLHSLYHCWEATAGQPTLLLFLHFLAPGKRIATFRTVTFPDSPKLNYPATAEVGGGGEQVGLG